MYSDFKRFLIGKPLQNEAEGEQKYGILWGLPILASDAISSVAYAGQEILLVLLPAIGILAYGQLSYISFAIIGLLALLMLSYRQTIKSYPNGGGAYIVAKDNLGIIAGVTAGAALSVDYILTVAVSVSSGVEQVTSAFLPLRPYTVVISVLMVLLLMIGNLRGIRESSRIFGIPAYAFIIAMLSMLVVGFIKLKGGYIPPEPTIQSIGEPITMILILKAFSSGCSALTGVEAVSNAVPNFKHPSVKHARTVLLLLSIIILVLFGGTSLMANAYHVVPGEKALLILMAEEVFGRNIMFYYLMATTFIILVLAANTAYSGFPLLVAVMAKEGYVPRQLSMRGDRLSYSNGILVLSLVSAILIIVFKAKVTALIGLYAVGVFISFTLSQTGMFVKWIKTKEGHWLAKALVNGTGAVVTAVTVVIIAFTKFEEGAWVVVLLIPILIFMMLKVKKHYVAVKKQLRLKPEELAEIDVDHSAYVNRVIVPIESVNRSSVRALRYAMTISNNVIAFSVQTSDEEERELKGKYLKLNTGIPLIVKYSPYRKVVEPLLKFIESAEYEYEKGDMITVILPQFTVKRWWHSVLHNHTRIFVQRELLKHKHIVVAVMPLQLKDDNEVLSNPKYN
ncbi:MAG TPA: APC family permease [Clostridia bacterium]|nr:APC family permease [Clostridia bacterium]